MVSLQEMPASGYCYRSCSTTNVCFSAALLRGSDVRYWQQHQQFGISSLIDHGQGQLDMGRTT